MDESLVLLSYPCPGVAEVRLNRPEKLNALVPELFDSLVSIGERLSRDEGLSAVVLSAVGPAFCAGLDRSCFEDGSLSPGSLVPRTHGIANLYQQAAWVWRTLPVPVVAALSGAAYGGGLQIALGADVRFARQDVQMSVMEINWGLIPDMAGMALLRRLVRNDVMRDLCLSGRVFSGVEALQLGLVTRLCADPAADAMAWAREIADKSPAAVRAMKRLMNHSELDVDQGLLMAESQEQSLLLGSAEQQEAVRARLGKRRPKFLRSAGALGVAPLNQKSELS